MEEQKETRARWTGGAADPGPGRRRETECRMFDRTRMLIGEAALNRIRNAEVAVFGLGGVGGFVTEALVRAGVGALMLVDFDRIEATNLNRQIVALHSTLGQQKTDVMAARACDIRPDLRVRTCSEKLTADTVGQFDFTEYDYIVDAIDDVSAKILLIETAAKCNVPILSSMGTGNKLDPSRFQIAEIHRTHTCPLAKCVRQAFRDRETGRLKVLFSTERPRRAEEPDGSGKISPASISFVPSAAGLMIAGEVIRDLADLTPC